ncbi:MAG: hypothetical protein AB7G76_02955 [Steroidobacteraceae bacterium]
MSDLVVILPVAGAAARTALASPLARARRRALGSADWRAWLARRLGRADLAVRPAATVAAAALGVPPGAAWFATPVALLAAVDHVRMPSAGWLALEADETAVLAADFTRVFEGTGHALTPAGSEGFLLTGVSTAAITHDPARVLGGDIAPWLPTGEGAAPLRRIGTEIEMWLHEHPVNRTRVRRGAAPLAGLWLWGGESPAPAAPAQPHDRVGTGLPRGYGGDSWLRGLWQAGGRTLDGPGRAFAELELARDADTVVVVREGVDDRVAAHWVDPALAALAARRIDTVEVVADERVFRYRRFDLVKPWRRPVAWAVPT